MTATRPPELKLGHRRIPVLLPSLRDPRLHVAAVVISIHVIGISALGFRVSVPQILTAIVTAGLIEVFVTFRQSGKLVWPASGMLTGSGVALILRLADMGRGDYWNWIGWQYFALVAAASVLSKYVIRFRGSHLFNPSNIGLVVAFLLVGATVLEPLDFWWAPIDMWMILAYVIIIGGGIAITRRLGLLEMALAFWIAFASFLGVLAASGHCMTAAWSLTPVCGSRFWSVVVMSPEILIFLFFMITDPKTVPRSRGARVAFSVTLAVLSTLLIAPQALEYGAKVALLSSLVVWSPFRRLFDRLVPTADEGSGVQAIANWFVGPGRSSSAFLRGAVTGSVVVLLAGLVVMAGTPAREAILVATPEMGLITKVDVDPASLPLVTVDSDVYELNADLDQEGAQALALVLAENLALEEKAIRDGDGSILGSADAGLRLAEMQQELDTALATGARIASEYRFAGLSLHQASGGGQAGAALEFWGRGAVDRVAYDALGVEQSRVSETFEMTFVLRQIGDDRWRLVEVGPIAG